MGANWGTSTNLALYLVYQHLFTRVIQCVFEDRKLSFHKHVVLFTKNFKSINPTSKNQVFACFSAQEDFHMRPSQLLGNENYLVKNPRISLYSDN